MKVANATATYTGGGIYLYTGQLDNKDYFFTADDYMDYVLLLDSDPYADMENCCYEEWQTLHKTGELGYDKANALKKDIMQWILNNKPKGNYLESEILKRLSRI